MYYIPLVSNSVNKRNTSGDGGAAPDRARKGVHTHSHLNLKLSLHAVLECVGVKQLIQQRMTLSRIRDLGEKEIAPI